MNILYCTPEMKIGKHQWRCRVEESEAYGAVWMYQWRRIAGEFDADLPGRWRPMEQWHKYNSNASDGGLPRTIETLYHRYEWEIFEATIRGKERWLIQNETGPYAWRWENARKDLERDKERFAGLKPNVTTTPAGDESPLF